MKYRLFQFPIPVDDGELGELNRFLAEHRITAKSHQVVGSRNPILLFIIEYTEEAPTGTKSTRQRIDSREELSDAEFVVFSRLRDVRKSIAEQDGVPVYTIFTNAQLAEMVRKSIASLADLASIEGIGKARVEKYGKQVLRGVTRCGDR